jgi:DNA-binding transcriptional MerR regulator
MRIGELADQAGTTTRALRLYEEMGLLAARRSANGYRQYDENDVRMVREILSLRAVGFALDETRPFVECLRSGHETGDSCPDSIAVYRRKLAEVDGYLDRLTTLRSEITGKLAEACARRCGTVLPRADDQNNDHDNHENQNET